MRWLLILITCLVMSCATVRAEPEGMLPPPQYKVLKQQGWVSMNTEGDLWFLMARVGGNLYRIGSCQLKFRTEGFETWRAGYYVHGNDFFWNKFLKKDKDSLSECVEWVEHQALGDFYL